MRFSPGNFLYSIKQIVTGRNGDDSPGSGTAQAADGGIKSDKPIPLTAIVNPTTQFPVITDSTGGTPSATFAAITAPAANATTSLTADMVAVKNALAEIALILNAKALANSTANTGTIPVYIVAAGTNPTIGQISFTIPRDYDEASDAFSVRLFVQLANADAGITVTGTATVLPLGGSPTTGSAKTGTVPFTTITALSTTEQVLNISFAGLNLKRDTVIAITLALAGTTTGNTLIYGVEYLYDSTIVSYNETDATDDTSGGSLIGFGNPLR